MPNIIKNNTEAASIYSEIEKKVTGLYIIAIKLPKQKNTLYATGGSSGSAESMFLKTTPRLASAKIFKGSKNVKSSITSSFFSYMGHSQRNSTPFLLEHRILPYKTGGEDINTSYRFEMFSKKRILEVFDETVYIFNLLDDSYIRPKDLYDSNSNTDTLRIYYYGPRDKTVMDHLI